jgi:hypothetical protein
MPMVPKTSNAPAVVSLVLSACVGVGAALFLYVLARLFGPTSGFRVDGVVWALKFGAVPLLLVVVLAGVATRFGWRSSRWLRVLPAVAVLLGVIGLLIAGAQGAVGRYDDLAKQPECPYQGLRSETAAMAAQQAFNELKHPGPFDRLVSASTEGCGSYLLNVTFAEAAAHYRTELPKAGWTIQTDNDIQLVATRGLLIFILTHGCNNVPVDIRTTPFVINDQRDWCR